MLERSVKEMPDHLWRLMPTTECEEEAYREELRRQILKNWVPTQLFSPQEFMGRFE